jgi:RNA polymerase sigma-70 factor (ECF subfamily)
MVKKKDDPDPGEQRGPGEPSGRIGGPDEALLIERAQQGDHGAFESLVRLHHRRVLAVIGSFIRRHQDVEDLAQEVFVRAYLAIGRFRLGAPFSPWIHRIAVNACYDHLRGVRRNRELAFTDLAEGEVDFLERYTGRGGPGSEPDQADRLAGRDLADRVLGTLSPKDRLAITLREVQGLEIAEIADLLGCSRAAVKVRLFRARRAMQSVLRGFIGHGRVHGGTASEEGSA